MSTDARVEGNGAGYADLPVTKAPNWHGLVAWDMLFNNLTTGLFLTAAMGELLAPAVFLPLVKVAYPLALLLLLIDLACLVLDLGDPLRFHHMLRVFKPSSPMSLGTWCLTAYSLPLTVAALIGLLQSVGWVIDPPYELARKSAVVLGLLPALGSAVYKGVLLSTTSQPGWKDARWMGGYLASAAILLGCAEMLVLAVLMGQGRAVALLRIALVCLLLLNDLFLDLLRTGLNPALKQIYGPRKLSQRGMLGVVCEILPLFLILFGNSAPLQLAAVVFLLLGSVAIRFEIIKIPHALSSPSTERKSPFFL